MAVDVQLEKEKEQVQPFSVGYWALRIHLAHHALLADALKSKGLSGAQIFFMSAISRFRNGDPSLKDLAKDLGFTHPAVVRQINELEKAGFVEKYVPEDDKRVRYVRFTEKGQECVPFIRDVFKKVKMKMEEGITYEEKSVTMDVLKRTYMNLMKEVRELD